MSKDKIGYLTNIYALDISEVGGGFSVYRYSNVDNRDCVYFSTTSSVDLIKVRGSGWEIILEKGSYFRTYNHGYWGPRETFVIRRFSGDMPSNLSGSLNSNQHFAPRTAYAIKWR